MDDADGLIKTEGGDDEMPMYCANLRPICPGCVICLHCSPSQLLVIGVAGIAVLAIRT